MKAGDSLFTILLASVRLLLALSSAVRLFFVSFYSNTGVEDVLPLQPLTQISHVVCSFFFFEKHVICSLFLLLLLVLHTLCMVEASLLLNISSSLLCCLEHLCYKFFLLLCPLSISLHIFKQHELHYRGSKEFLS